jgi:hypothetical protein
MTTKHLLGVAAVALFVLAAFASSVQAQERAPGAREFFAGSLGVGGEDVFGILCGLGTTGATCDVNDNGGVDGVRMFACITDGNSLGNCTFTAVDNGIAPAVSVFAGPGVYLCIIGRTGGGAVEAYDTVINCSGADADDIRIVQNQ